MGKANKNLTKNSAIFQKIDWNFEKISYEEWIRNVAENLIQVNIVEDSVSQNFRKVFDLKVTNPLRDHFIPLIIKLKFRLKCVNCSFYTTLKLLLKKAVKLVV